MFGMEYNAGIASPNQSEDNGFWHGLETVAGNFLEGLGNGLGTRWGNSGSEANPPNPTYNGQPSGPTTGTPTGSKVTDYMPLLIGGGIVVAAILLLKK